MTDRTKPCPTCGEAMDAQRHDICEVCADATSEERQKRREHRAWAEKHPHWAEHVRWQAQMEQLVAKRAREPMTDRRDPGPCRRCGHHQLIRCWVMERAPGEFNPERGTIKEQLWPMSVAHVKVGTWRGSGAPVGVFHAYICRSCGFTEWYVAHPEDIPIGPQFGTELVTHRSGPYR